MRAELVDLLWQRRLTLRQLACALSELKCLAAETRLERAMRRHAVALRIVPQSNGTTRHIGKDAVVVLNPAGGVVTVWRR
ncbi:MAG TPA: hypothetical protein VNR39_19835 [Pseudolabrys sp.]|nr:hypothetical protein [Pseudolabrys sp.]